MSEQDDSVPPKLKTDFLVKQAGSIDTPITKQMPVMIVLCLVGVGALFGAVQLITYCFNYDKLSAMKNVDVSLQHPIEKDGVAYVAVDIANYNPAPIQNTAFTYQVIDSTGKIMKTGKVTIPALVPPGESRTFPEISLDKIPSGHIHPELVDLKYGPKPSLSSEQSEKFVTAAMLKPKESLRAFVELVQSAPEFVPGYVRLGEALAANNDLDNAIKAYQKAIRIDPDDVSAHYNLGVAYYYKKDKHAAAEEFQAAAKLEPDDPAVLASLKQLGGK